jgi:LPS sulfotransferase NodH
MNGLLDNINLWVLANYRNGSIFLCRFLNKVGGYNREFYERFNPLRPSTLKVFYKDSFLKNNYKKWERGNLSERRKLFLTHVIEKNLLPPRIKIMRDQFMETCGLTDQDKDLIESKLPGLKYIFIKRTDCFSITISHYFSLKTGWWVLKPEDKRKYLETNVEFDEKELLTLYKRIKYYIEDNNWDKYLADSDYLYIDFDDLIKNPAVTFSKVLAYLGIDKGLVDIERLMNAYEFIPTKRPETVEYVERLKNIVAT